MATDSPKCQICGKTRNVPFDVFPKTRRFKFGQICVPCDDIEHRKDS